MIGDSRFGRLWGTKRLFTNGQRGLQDLNPYTAPIKSPEASGSSEQQRLAGWSRLLTYTLALDVLCCAIEISLLLSIHLILALDLAGSSSRLWFVAYPYL